MKRILLLCAAGITTSLLSPQVRFNYAKIQQMFPDKLVLKIGAEDYKNLNAEKIIKDLKNNLK